MEAFEAYTLYLAMKRHFTINNKYDFFKYRGKTNATKISFDTRKDKYSFHKLSKKPNPQDYLLANFVEHGSAIWVGDLVNEKKYEDTYLAWVKRQQSLTYTFKNELKQITDLDNALKVNDGQYPELLNLFVKNKVSMETLIILNDILKFFPKWQKQIIDTAFWPSIYNNAIKYQPFLNYDKTKFIKLTMDCFAEQ